MTHAERWDGGVAQEGPVDAGVRAGWPARRKWAAGVAGVVLIVVVGGGVVAVRWFGRGEPPWWEASNPLSPRVVRNAEGVEGAVLRHVTAVRPVCEQRRPVLPDPMPMMGHAPGIAPGTPVPAGDWSVSISGRDACDWLSVRLPLWLANQNEPGLPAGVECVRVAFAPEGLYLGAMVERAGAKRVVWALVTPRVDADGALWLPASSVGIGTATLPLDRVAQLARAGSDADRPHLARLASVLEGREPAMVDASLRVDAARRVRLTDLATGEGRLVVTAVTEAE